MLAVVKMSDFHECAGVVAGIQGTTLRLAGGFTALCKYLGMTSDLKSLWVDERVLSESTAFSANDAEPLLCTKALSCMFDDEVVDAIDRATSSAKLERHGYRKSASKGAGTNGGGFFRKQKSVKDDITPQMSYEVALEATAYPRDPSSCDRVRRRARTS